MIEGAVFYDCATAPSPRRARMAMAEKGLSFDTVQIDLKSGEQLGDAYRAINPRCTVPALKLPGGTILADNASIVRWLEEIRPDPPLLGRDPVEKALVAEWLSRVEFEGLLAIAEVLRNTSGAFRGRALTGPEAVEQIPELAARGRARAAVFLTRLNERLEAAPWLGGDGFSAADIAGYVFVDFAKWVKLEPGPELAALAEWRAAIAERPSAKA